MLKLALKVEVHFALLGPMEEILRRTVALAIRRILKEDSIVLMKKEVKVVRDDEMVDDGWFAVCVLSVYSVRGYERGGYIRYITLITDYSTKK